MSVELTHVFLSAPREFALMARRLMRLHPKPEVPSSTYAVACASHDLLPISHALRYYVVRCGVWAALRDEINRYTALPTGRACGGG